MPEPLCQIAIKRSDRELFNQLRLLYSEANGHPKTTVWFMFSILSEKVVKPWVDELRQVVEKNSDQ